MSGSVSRFIPAPAGNTVSMVCDITQPPVHPRACGEHLYGIPSSVLLFGSSPRLRGTLLPEAFDIPIRLTASMIYQKERLFSVPSWSAAAGGGSGGAGLGWKGGFGAKTYQA